MDLDNTEAQCNKLEKIWIRVEKEGDENRCSSKHGKSFVLNKEIINSTSCTLYSSYRLPHQERHDICQSKEVLPLIQSSQSLAARRFQMRLAQGRSRAVIAWLMSLEEREEELEGHH